MLLQPMPQPIIPPGPYSNSRPTIGNFNQPPNPSPAFSHTPDQLPPPPDQFFNPPPSNPGPYPSLDHAPDPNLPPNPMGEKPPEPEVKGESMDDFEARLANLKKM
eukprot:TRINITY_DN1888_c0_g1_i14.p3 TRINITY_DN1888_c0_g1~~TRINITY_DN1888_c0_g1_i14.p3  ORF type:complete len:105 (+),score=15.97 TRINITY_DN1888_c0_g1_i14:757-1071(+)